jgi:hypothetical protein
MNKTTIIIPSILAIIAITMVMAPTMSAYSQEEVKKPKEPKANEICDPKVNVKALGDSILNGTEYTATLAGVTQTKVAEEDGTVNFHFDFKAKKPKAPAPAEAKPSGKGTCFITGTTLSGDVEGTAFDANINKKTTKVQVTLTN